MARLAAAIVGCGTAGLASALFLHAAGVDVTLFEQFESPRPLGAGILLQPTGLAVLSELGLLERALERGARIDHILGTAVSGRKVLDVGYHRLSRHGSSRLASGLEHFGLGIHRGTLFDAGHGELIGGRQQARQAARDCRVRGQAARCQGRGGARRTLGRDATQPGRDRPVPRWPVAGGRPGQELAGGLSTRPDAVRGLAGGRRGA